MKTQCRKYTFSQIFPVKARCSNRQTQTMVICSHSPYTLPCTLLSSHQIQALHYQYSIKAGFQPGFHWQLNYYIVQIYIPN